MVHSCPKSFLRNLFRAVSQVFYQDQLAGLKLYVKNEKTSITNFVFSTSSGCIFYKKHPSTNFWFLLLYYYILLLFLFERCYCPERNLSLADFLLMLFFLIDCSEISSFPHFLPFSLNSGCSESVSNFEDLSCAPSCFKVFSASNVSSSH